MDENTLEELARLAGLEIAPEYREGVLANLRVAALMAEKVHAVPLDADALEMAPTFRPWTLPDIAADD